VLHLPEIRQTVRVYYFRFVSLVQTHLRVPNYEIRQYEIRDFHQTKPVERQNKMQR
jgi:hypothetical protein